jgi:hypothetical protein
MRTEPRTPRNCRCDPPSGGTAVVPRRDGARRLMLTLWSLEVTSTCTQVQVVPAGVEGLEPPTHLVLETRALPVELRPYVQLSH